MPKGVYKRKKLEILTNRAEKQEMSLTLSQPMPLKVFSGTGILQASLVVSQHGLIINMPNAKKRATKVIRFDAIAKLASLLD